MNISERIRAIRIRKGYKQTAIAEEMGVTQQSYSCLETGANKSRIATLLKFCEATNIELSFLISDEPVTDESILKHSTK